jgi:glucokinase
MTKTQGAIGIDIGGTKSLFALFDEKFALLEEIKVPTHPEKGGGRAFRATFRDSVRQLLKRAKKRGVAVRAIGIGCAGLIDLEKAKVRASPNVKFLKDLAFRPLLEAVTPLPVYVANDVQAGLYGEHQLGAARDARHAIGIFIGTGIGGALVIDGKLYRGATGVAGDIGNYLLHAIGPLAGSDREGVLDDIASRTAIAGDAATLAAKRSAPALHKMVGSDVRQIKSSDLAKAIRKGDRAVERLVRSRARVVGIALSNLVDFINPEVIVLGGGLVEALPKLVRNEVRKGIAAHSTRAATRGLKVTVATLHNHAVTTGAAKLAVDAAAGKRSSR